MLKDIAFIKRAPTRNEVFKNLKIPQTPTKLALEIGKHRSSISDAITELGTEGLVKNITPKGKKFTLYQLTPKGNKIFKKMKKMGL